MTSRRLTTALASVVMALGSMAAGAMAAGAPAQAIVGGSQVQTNYSFLAFVPAVRGGGFCSGVLIKSDWVATAKHCSTPTSARVGSISKSSGGTVVNVDRATAHPTLDIKLLHLTTAVSHAPIPIAAAPLSPTNVVRVVGWGRTCLPANPCSPPDIAHEIRRVANPDDDCDTLQSSIDDEFEVCIGNHNGGSGACNGDSGGPVIRLTTPPTTFNVQGVVSRGDRLGCGSENTVAIDMVALRSWISRTVGGGLPT